MMTYPMPLLISPVFAGIDRADGKDENHRFTPKIGVFAENSRYYLESAQNQLDLVELFRMRYEVFFGNGTDVSGLDYDEFDWIFDHLTIREKATGEVCGTYRICAQEFTQKFYSEGEFEIAELLSQPGNKIEVGRACIRDSHRNGQVLDLLWRGIGQYIKKTQASMIFGCSSIMSISSQLAYELTEYFSVMGVLNTSLVVRPKEKYRLLPRQVHPVQYTSEDLRSIVPTLISSYLRAGATLGSVPAIDVEFGSIDFLTILNIAEMHAGYQKRYLQ